MFTDFVMTDERIKKLRADIIANRPDVSTGSSPTQKRKTADLYIKDLRKRGVIQDVYFQRVQDGAIKDLELYDKTVIRQASKKPLSSPSDNSSVIQVEQAVPKQKVKKVPKLVHFSPDVLARLEEIASDVDCSSSFLIRKAVDNYIKSVK
jgi:hypothetical protein